MKFTGTVVALYGIIVVLGGLIGYLAKDSLPSLIAGSVCGALLFASGLGLLRSSILAFFTGLTVSLCLTLFFSYRFYLSQALMPAGMMAIISGLIFLLTLSSKGKPKKKRI